jgi:pyruvate,water dikinase
VPDGFVVTTDAYAIVTRPIAPRISQRIAAGDGVSIRADVEAAVMPRQVSAAIAAAYAELGAGSVAVRSSATAEDLPGAAFAGQQDTYLDVTGEAAVIEAVQRCWGSLWTDRAIAYRSRIGIDEAGIMIAVVVQRMINAEVAGVMFTADPISGNRETIMIEASRGLGEGSCLVLSRLTTTPLMIKV